MTQRAQSSIDHQQQRGVAMDIVDQAIEEYDQWMLDDDYDAMTFLHSLMGRMRARRELYHMDADGERLPQVESLAPIGELLDVEEGFDAGEWNNPPDEPAR